jgi:nucleotide-binding universal stress UspA family protein
MNVEWNESDRSGGTLVTSSNGHRRIEHPRGAGDPKRIETILVALSTETPSSGVIDLVSDLGRRLDAKVVVFHVREWPFSGSEWVLGEGGFVEGKEEATRLVDRVIRRLGSMGIQARGMSGGGRPGQVGDAIVDAARATHADLIVLGFHRHSLLEELLAGGVVRKVRRFSESPVLTVPRRRGPSLREGADVRTSRPGVRASINDPMDRGGE